MTQDLADHVPGHALIAKLLTEWDAGRIRLGDTPGEVVIDDESRGWYWGVLGERKVAEILATLGPYFVTLHSVPIGTKGADVDHLTIGPSGVFCINTKYHPGASIWTAGHGLKVNGITKRYLHNSVYEAKRVEERLSAATGFAVPVYPVIAFVGVEKFTQTAPSEIDGVEVRVTTASRLQGKITTRRELSDEQVARVIAAARNPVSWQTTLRPTAPGMHLAREFDALREALRPALETPRRPAPRAAHPARSPQQSRKQRQRLGTALLRGCLSLIVLVLLTFLLIQLLPVVLRALLTH